MLHAVTRIPATLGAFIANQEMCATEASAWAVGSLQELLPDEAVISRFILRNNNYQDGWAALGRFHTKV